MNAMTTIQTNNTDSISNRCMLVQLTIRQPAATTTDERVTQEVAQRESADNDAGKYNKRLLAKDATAKIQSAASNLRKIHYHRTLPWQDNGARILPTRAYFEYTKEINKAKDDFNKATADFINSYPDYVRAARHRLGNMFDETEYPDVSIIRKKFGVDVNVLPMPDAKDFRAALPDAELEIIRKDIQQQTKDALQRGTTDVFHRAIDVLQHMTTKLAEYQPKTKSQAGRTQGIFRDSLITNIKELADILPSLNVTNDSKLHRLSTQLASLASDYDPNDLRKDANTRASAQHEANSILATLKDYIQ